MKAFLDRLADTYRVMSNAFDVPSHPFRVFFRSHPHRGLNGFAHPASFVMAVNPEKPLDPSKIYQTLAHELVHEWLHLDGPEEEVRWFNEGAADYYSLALPYRVGLIGEDAFLRAVNLGARTGYANPRRHLTMGEAEPLFFSDFFAHWLPYTRGMFYLADLDGRLRGVTSGAGSVDDIVVEVTRRRRDGERVGIHEWCTIVERTLPGDEQRRLNSLVFTGEGRPAPDAYGRRFEMIHVHCRHWIWGSTPYIINGRVTGLVPGGLADRAGLKEGDTVDLPSFHDALALDVNDVITIGVHPRRSDAPSHPPTEPQRHPGPAMATHHHQLAESGLEVGGHPSATRQTPIPLRYERSTAQRPRASCSRASSRRSRSMLGLVFELGLDQGLHHVDAAQELGRANACAVLADPGSGRLAA